MVDNGTRIRLFGMVRGGVVLEFNVEVPLGVTTKGSIKELVEFGKENLEIMALALREMSLVGNDLINISFGRSCCCDYRLMGFKDIHTDRRNAQEMANRFRIEEIRSVEGDGKAVPFTSVGGSSDINAFVVEKTAAKDDVVFHSRRGRT